MIDDNPRKQEADGTVTISAETAETALLELDHLIHRSGGPDGHELPDGTVKGRTPLALALARLDAAPGDHSDAEAIIRAVGKETGEEVAQTDPLTGATFDARTELQQAIDEYLGGGDQ